MSIVLFEEATRFMSTKSKRFKHAAHRLGKKQKTKTNKKKVWAEGWVNTHYDFCTRMVGVSVAMVSLWKRLIGWLLLPQNNNNNNTASWFIHSTGRTLTVYNSIRPDAEPSSHTYSHTTKSK